MARTTSAKQLSLPNLSQALWSLTVDNLKWHAVVMLKQVPLKKANLVDTLSALLLNRDSLRQLYAALEPEQQAVVAEVVHKHVGIYKRDVIEAKFPGVRAPRNEAGGMPFGYYGFGIGRQRDVATPFDLFFYHVQYQNSYQADWLIPADMLALLRTFTQQPPATSMLSYEELPPFGELHAPPRRAKPEYYVSQTENSVFHDLTATLDLIDKGKVSVSTTTKLPMLPAVRLLKERLLVGDYFAEQEYGRAEEAIRTLAFVAITEAAKWATRQGTGSRLELTLRGKSILGSIIGEKQVKEAWEQWVKSNLLDELSRVRAIKGQQSYGAHFTKPAARREKLVQAMRTLPTGRWVAFDEFLRYMRAEGLMPVIEQNEPSVLYISSNYYGQLAYSGARYWDIVVGSYIRATLWEYAATLGLVEIAYTTPESSNHDFGDFYGLEDEPYLSRYDGLLALKLTELGAYALGLRMSYTPVPNVPGAERGDMEEAPLLRVLPNLDIVITDPHRMLPNERTFLKRIATPQSDHVYQLNRDTMVDAIETGLGVQQVRKFLAQRSRLAEDQLPNTVLTFFSDIERRAEMLREEGEMLVLSSDDPYLLEEIANLTPVRGIAQIATVGQRKLLLIPEARKQALRRQIKKMGYVLKKARIGPETD